MSHRLEDRHVMQHHGSGAVLSLLRNVALTLLRGLLIVVVAGTAHRQSTETRRSTNCCTTFTLTLERPCRIGGCVAWKVQCVLYSVVPGNGNRLMRVRNT